MRIAIFTPTFLPKCSGAEIFHHNLASQFVRMGHRISVILPKSLNNQIIEKKWALDYQTIPYPANIWSWFKRSAPLALWLNRLVLARIQRRHRFHVWHAVVLSPSGVCFADWQSRSKVPGLIRAVGDDVRDVDGAKLPSHMRSMIRSRIPRSQRMVALSRDMKSGLEDLGVPANRIELIPNAVDHERFSASVDKTALRRIHGIPSRAFVYLCVARNHPQKDLSTLLRAFKIASEASPGRPLHLVIVGRGVPELRGETNALGLSEAITLLDIQPPTIGNRPPEYPPQALVDLYRAADGFVLSSLLEGFSTALLEAMAAALPIVATKVPGIMDQIEDGRDGLLVPAKNPTALAQALGKLASDPDFARNLSIQARERALTFRWERVAEQYLAVYEQLIAEAETRMTH